MVASGAAVTIIGAMLLIGGVVMLATSGGSGSDSDDDPFPGIMGVVGGVLVGTGALHVVIGIPLMVAGSGASSSDPPKRTVDLSQALPAVGVGPRSVSMRWAF